MPNNSSRTSSCSSSHNNVIPEDLYTEWRQIYERSASQLSNYYTKPEDIEYSDLSTNFLNLKEQELMALREFRLQNSEECFSTDSLLPLLQKMERQNHTCEFMYKINERGLLEPQLQTKDGRDICGKCKKPSENQTTYKLGMGKQSIPIIPHLKSLNGKIKIDESKGKSIGKYKCHPRNSLALCHQEKWNLSDALKNLIIFFKFQFKRITNFVFL